MKESESSNNVLEGGLGLLPVRSVLRIPMAVKQVRTAISGTSESSNGQEEVTRKTWKVDSDSGT